MEFVKLAGATTKRPSNGLLDEAEAAHTILVVNYTYEKKLKVKLCNPFLFSVLFVSISATLKCRLSRQRTNNRHGIAIASFISKVIREKTSIWVCRLIESVDAVKSVR